MSEHDSNAAETPQGCVRFGCSNCHSLHTAPPANAGQRFKCGCGTVLVVPMFDRCTEQGVPIKYEGVWRDTREPWGLIRHLVSWVQLPDLADEVCIHDAGRPAGAVMHFFLRWWFPFTVLSWLVLVWITETVPYGELGTWNTGGFLVLFFGPLAGFVLCFAWVKNCLLMHFKEETGVPCADPDLGDTVEASRYVMVGQYDLPGRQVTQYQRVDETLARRDFELREEWNWFKPPRSVYVLQDVLNRHWAFHWRQEQGGTAIFRMACPAMPRALDHDLATLVMAECLIVGVFFKPWVLLGVAASIAALFLLPKWKAAASTPPADAARARSKQLAGRVAIGVAVLVFVVGLLGYRRGGDFAQYSRPLPPYVYGAWTSGMQAADRGDYDKALEIFNQTIAKYPKDSMGYDGRAYAFVGKEQSDAAIADCNESIRLFPQPFAYSVRGAAYRLKGEYDRAIADLTKGTKFLPSEHLPFTWRNRGEAYRQKGEYDKAIADFNLVLYREPRCVFSFKGRGAAFRKKREFDKAVADLTKALELDPNDAFAQEELALARQAKD